MHLRYVLHFHSSLSSTGILPALILSTVTLRGYSHPSKCSPLPSPCAEIPRNRILKQRVVKISSLNWWSLRSMCSSVVRVSTYTLQTVLVFRLQWSLPLGWIFLSAGLSAGSEAEVSLSSLGWKLGSLVPRDHPEHPIWSDCFQKSFHPRPYDKP